MKISRKLEGVSISVIRQMNARAKGSTINLGIGQLPYAAPNEVVVAGKQALDTGNTRYTANAGMLALREAIAADHMERTGIFTTEDNVIVTNGAEGAVWNVMYCYLDEGDEVLIPEIGFSIYETIAQMQGATVTTYKLHDDFSIDLKDLDSKVHTKTKLLVINNPNNPTGVSYDASEIKKIAELLEYHSNLYCISDEIYKDLYLDGEMVDTPASLSDKVIVVDGISKRGSATGLRIGWTIATKLLTDPMIIANQYITTCASSVSQAAALPILQGKCHGFEHRVREDLAKNRDIAYTMLSEIDGVHVVRPSGAFYIFPDISAYGSSREVALLLLEECDVLTIPGIAFGDRGDKHIRISFAVDIEVLKEGLQRIQQALQKVAHD